jgi:hypothetical protein
MLFSNNSPSTRWIFSYFMISISVACPAFYLTPRAFCTFDNPDQIDFGQYWYVETPIPQLMIGTQYYTPRLIQSSYLFLVMLISYGMSILIGKMTLLELKRKSKSMSFKTKALQNQLARFVGRFLIYSRFLELYLLNPCVLYVIYY